MAAPRTLLFAAAIALAPAGGQAEPPPLKLDMKCGKPKIKAVLQHPREEVAYDLEKHPDFAREGKPLGLFTAGHRIAYSGKVEGGCLRALTVTIAVTPKIHLRAIYTKKSKKCARQLVLDHERGHARVAKREYKALKAEIEKRVFELFVNRRVPDVKTAEAHLGEILDGGILPRFEKRYRAAQDTFHGKLAQADIVKKKCRLVKRKR